jgi:Protein of unknown function (DUF3300)
VARTTLAVILIVLLTGGQSIFAQAQQPAAGQPAAGQPAPAAAPLPPEQLDSLVAPIALYPDPLLSQTLVASTYPLEMVQLQQWLEKHKDLKDAALTEAVKKEDWDPSIQAMAALPDVVKLLSENITWTTDLGNAFLAQQADVMAAVQRMRKKAEDTGNLKTTEQQKVETKVVEQKQVIVVEQANPEVIYVPTYSPTVVYGPPPVVYAYPPIAYPPYTGVGVAFTAGIIMGAAFSGGWGYNCGWGSSNVNINVNNNFVKNSNVNRNQINNGMANGGRGGNNTWQHNPQHRGAAPYGDRSTASKYGGTTRGDSAAAREASARQQQSQRAPSAGTSDRSGSADRGAGGANRSAGADRSAGGADRGAGGADRGASAGDRSSPGGGGDRVGNRSVPSSSSTGAGGAFGGSGSHGSSARASSQRGGSSMGGGGRSGGGGRRR